MTQTSEIQIRQPRDDEWPKVRKMAPQAFRGRVPFVLIAVHGESGDIVGLGGMRGRRRRSGPLGFFLWIRVNPDHRRKGYGQALMNAFIAHAREKDAAATIRAGRPVAEGSPAAWLMEANGFARLTTVTHFETDIQKYRSLLAPIRDRLVRNDKIPVDHRILALKDAPMNAVQSMVVAQFGGRPERVAINLIGEGPGAYAPNESVVLTVGGEVVGVLLVRLRDDLAVVPVNVIKPAYRNGWANVVLKLAATERIISAGMHRVRFAANDTQHSDTMKLGQRVDASEPRVMVVYRLAFNEKALERVRADQRP